MRWWGLLIIGIASYLVFLIAGLPAHYTLSGLALAGVPVTAASTSGTLWSGKAEGLRYNKMDFTAVNWQFKPLSLLQGELKYSLGLQNPGQELKGYAALSLLGSYVLTEYKGLLNAQHLPELIGQPYIKTSGDLDVDIETLEIAQARVVSAKGTIRWLNAGIQSPVSAQLGGLEFDLKGDKAALVTDIRDINGPLKIQGALNLKPDGQYRLSGKVKPTASADPALARALRNFGRAAADGNILIEYTGQL